MRNAFHQYFNEILLTHAERQNNSIWVNNLRYERINEIYTINNLISLCLSGCMLHDLFISNTIKVLKFNNYLRVL